MAKGGPSLADRLSALLQTVKNQSELSRVSGVSRQTISAIASGLTKSPSVETLEALAPWLNTTVDYLRHGKDADEDDIQSLAQFHAYRAQQQRQEERHLERVIHAEVERRLNERWEVYIAQRLAELRRQAPVLADALAESEVAVAQAHQRQLVSDELDRLSADAVRQDGRARTQRAAAAGRAAGR